MRVSFAKEARTDLGIEDIILKTTKGRRSLCKERKSEKMATDATNETFDLSIEGEKIKICPFEWPNLS